MEKSKTVSGFIIRKFTYKYHHTTGSLISFVRPCIGYITKGSAEFLYQGKTISAHEGDLIYIAADTSYYSVWTGSPEIEFYSIEFEYGNKYSFFDYRFQILSYQSHDIFDEMYTSQDTDILKSLSLFYSLLSDIYTKMKKETVPLKALAIAPAVKYIEEHYNENIKIGTLAKLCSCSESYIFMLFKKHMGVSPIIYKHNIQIQHALEMLEHTDKNIEEISDILGFSSSNYFRRIFLKLTGKTPKSLKNS